MFFFLVISASVMKHFIPCLVTSDTIIIGYCTYFLIAMFALINAADSAAESTESDDEFQICEICNAETVLLFDILRWLELLHYVTYL